MSNYELDLYTLSPGFLIRHKVERYSSLIWTERYSSAGDFQVVMPPTRLWIDILVPGCLVGLRGRREIMKVQNQSFENGLMTVTGSSLLKYLNNRISWFKNPDYDPPDDTNLVGDYETDDLTPGEFISDVVDKLFVNPPPFDPPYDDVAFDWQNDHFGHLSLGYIDHRGEKKELSFPNAQPVYDALQQIAAQEDVGISMYLAWANFSTHDYSLRFITYRGKDRTSGQTDRETIRFSPKLESLSDIKELRSKEEYKNVCYVNYKGKVSVHYPEHIGTPPTGFRRRVTYVDISDKKIKAAKLPAARRRAARKEFRAHRHTHQVDGQILGNLSEWKFGTDYHLGDIVEVEGNSGLIVRARVSEYVRSQDQYGPKNYPTLEIMAEDETNYPSDPTFEPNVSDPVYPPSSSARITPSMVADGPIDVGPVVAPVFEDIDVDISPDPQEQVGDLLDPSSEIPTVTTQGLSPLTPWEVSDWFYETDRGFYVHQGNVYVVGSAAADSGTDQQGSATLLSGIPQQYAPDTPMTGKVLIDHSNCTYEYAYDSGLKIGPWLPVTISPEGTVTLDGGNPFQAPANPNDWSYLAIHLSTLTWPTAGSELYDAYDSDHSLDDWIGSAAHISTEFADSVPEDIWQNIDGTYSSHYERLHLNGRVKVVGAWKDYSYDALIGIPLDYQVKQSSESEYFEWCEVITRDGYRFYTYPPHGGHNTALYSQSGAQNPAAVGNKGCGFFASYFYERLSAGFLTRGSTPALSFTPATPDSGVSYTGCSGSPVGDLPDVANWVGNNYSGTIRCKPSDLLVNIRGVTIPPDWSLITGVDQFSFICGIAPGMDSYYKVVYTYDTLYNEVRCTLFLEKCGSADRALLASRTFTPSLGGDGRFGQTWNLLVSPNPSDVGYTGTLHSGSNYFLFQPGFIGLQVKGSDYVATPLVGSSPLPSGKSKGDMGFHKPSSASSSLDIEQLDISGIGTFPVYAEGDVIDFTNCGWPLY